MTARLRRVAAVGLARAVVGSGVVTFAAYWIATGVLRWQHLHVAAFDFAFFDQIIWNTSQGRLFETAFVPYNFAGQHMEPVLLLFAAAYRLGAGPLSLLVVQAIVCALAAVPLFEAARALRVPVAVGAAAALAYLANPYLHQALAFDFHPETMVTLPAFGAFWAFAAGRPRLGIACALSVLLFKEDAVFVVLALAAVAWTLGARRSAGLLVGSASAWAVLTVFVVIPHLRDGLSSDLVERYSALLGGHEGIQGVAWFVTHPFEIVATLATAARATSVVTFLAANGPWLLLAPLHALTLLPGMALALLSSHEEQQTLGLHYAVELVPVAAIAGLFGARRLLRVLPASLLTGLMLIVAAVALPLAGPSSEFTAHATSSAAHLEAVARAVAVVPHGESVSAQSSIASRFAHRRELWEFPGEWRRAQWVVVDRYGWVVAQSTEAGFDAELSAVRMRYELVFEDDGVAVYRAPR